ncbi:MAG: hypothetical protein U0271_16625 [Polyangiaceae bacterium]
MDDPCRVVCQRDVDCGFAEADYLEDCVSQCEEFSAQDEAYANAVEDRAECYGSEVDCGAVTSCIVSGE